MPKTKLTLRRATLADEAALVALGLDMRGFVSKGSHTFLCFEDGKAVGVARGVANWRPGVAKLLYAAVGPAERADILLALAEIHNDNALKLGQVASEIDIPEKGQCTNVLATPALVSFIGQRFSVDFADEGKDMATDTVAVRRLSTARVGLATMAAELKARLDALGCERVWDGGN